jgi:hypothetical protein
MFQFKNQIRIRNPEENIKKMNANKTPLAYTIAI